jgi:hypothetical protein
MAKTTLTDPVTSELRSIPRALKPGKRPDTLPKRLTLAKQQHHPARRLPRTRPGRRGGPPPDQLPALRARTAGLDPGPRIGTRDTTAAVRYDQQL